MQSVLQQVIPPSGVEFATFLKLREPNFLIETSTYITHLVVGRDDFLRIYEVREHVEKSGDKNEGTQTEPFPRKFPRLHLVRQHSLHGTITGIASVKTLASESDGRDRLLISFQDAKLALLEWSDTLYDIATVSIHSYERSPLLVNCDFTMCRATLRTDPAHRCAALCLPRDVLALLPWYQVQVDLDINESEKATNRDLPYSPSFLVEYSSIDERIRNVIDVIFLPGFHTPTMAILFQPQQTWTGRLKENNDNTCLYIITLDLVARSYQVIVTIDHLPYDSLYIVPCPTSIGGVMVISTNALFHIDQSSKLSSLPLNGWAKRVTDLMFAGDDPLNDLHLEGSHAAFMNETEFVIVLASGKIYTVLLEHEGRLVQKLVLQQPVGIVSPPSMVITHENLLLVTSTSYQTVLLSRDAKDEALRAGHSTLGTRPNRDDIPGQELNESRASHLFTARDGLTDPGLLTDAVFCVNKTTTEPLLLTSGGLGAFGGFSSFHRTLPTRLRKKLPAVAGRKGIWAMRINTDSRSGSKQSEKVHEDRLEDTILFSTDATPAPGASRIAAKSQARLDVNIISRLALLTVAAGPFFDRTHIVVVTTADIRLLAPDGSERQLLKDTDGNTVRPKIRLALIADPYILILREDDTLGLFVGEPSRSKLRRKDMTAFGDKKSKYQSACLFMDTTGMLQMINLGDNQTTRSSGTVFGANLIDARTACHWIALCRTSGVIEIWALPKLTLVFNATYTDGATSMGDTFLNTILSEQVNEEVLDQIQYAQMGESHPIPYLFLLFKSGLIQVYQCTPAKPPVDGAPIERTTSLNIQLVKVFSQTFPGASLDESVLPSALIADRRAAQRLLVPFTTTGRLDRSQVSGLFLTGDRPHWFFKVDKSDFICIPCDHSIVYAFTSCSIWEGPPAFLMNTEDGPCLIEWPSELVFHGRYGFERIRKGRTYSNLAFDAGSSLVIAASMAEREYVLYDDDGNSVWEPDASNVGLPLLHSSALELIDAQTWVTIDGFEFASNEVVNVVKTVNLETLSTLSGSKEFIAVGTSVHRGEDLAVRGATYVFEVADVVQDIEFNGKRRHRLKLLCREEAKGPVTALCDMNGYLVSSMGQKIFVRAFDLDERLVGVAFLDAGVYVTSLRSLKNLLLISDTVKSLWFIAFQEDPFKLVVLSRDVKPRFLLGAEFFINDTDLDLVSVDFQGVIRQHSYDPTHVDTEEGARLLCLVEYHSHSELAALLRIAIHSKKDDGPASISKLVIVYSNGSVMTMTPLEGDVFKRLHLLQSQLLRNTQHVAGLNPKMYRAVSNNTLGRGSSPKLVLDATLLQTFERLPISRQQEITAQIGERRDTIISDCLMLEAEEWLS